MTRPTLLGSLILLGATFSLAQVPLSNLSGKDADSTSGVAANANCVASNTTLCLSGGRFAVTAAWRTRSGSSGLGTAIPLTGDTGYFWFFDSTNVEVITKVLNACIDPFNAFWVFASGLTDVEVTLTYRDTVTGLIKTYSNSQGDAFRPIQDTSAFQTCSATPANANVTGTWGTTIGVPGIGQLAASVSLAQTGTGVTGTAAIAGFGSGSLDGSVSGQLLNFTINEINPCIGFFAGSLTINTGNNAASGDFTGSDCDGTWNASVVGSKLFGSSPPPPNTANVTGTWDATLVVNSVHVSTSFTLVQDGASVSGTAAVAKIAGLQSSNSGGLVTGTISGQTLTFTITEISPCVGSFHGTLTVSPNNQTINGSGSGSDCTGTYTASISGSKQ